MKPTPMITGTPVNPNTPEDDETIIANVLHKLNGNSSYSFVKDDADTLTVTFGSVKEEISWRLLDAMAESDDFESSLFIAVTHVTGPKAVLKERPTEEVLYTSLYGDETTSVEIKAGFLPDGRVVVYERYPFLEVRIRAFDPRCIASLFAWNDRDDCENDRGKTESDSTPLLENAVVPSGPKTRRATRREFRPGAGRKLRVDPDLAEKILVKKTGT